MAVVKAGNFRTNCQAILFDKDGTLIDFKHMWLVWLEYVISQILQKCQLTNELFNVLEKAIGVDLAHKWIDPEGAMASGNLTSLREAIASCLAPYGVKNIEAVNTFNEVVKASETEVDWTAITHPVPGLKETLAELKDKGIKMAVVTADTSRRAENTLASLGLTAFFDAVIGADLVKKTKPAPEMAFLACEVLNVQPREAVVVGDNVTDMCMGQEAGLVGKIGVLTGVCFKHQLEAVADVVVKSVAEIRTA